MHEISPAVYRIVAASLGPWAGRVFRGVVRPATPSVRICYISAHQLHARPSRLTMGLELADDQTMLYNLTPKHAEPVATVATRPVQWNGKLNVAKCMFLHQIERIFELKISITANQNRLIAVE